MDVEIVMETINSIFDCGNPKYTTPSGALIELLRELSQQSRIAEIPAVLNKYCRFYPESAEFLRNRVPSILINNYFTIREDLNYDKFIQYSQATADWSQLIEENAFNLEGFVPAVENVIKESNSFVLS